MCGNVHVLCRTETLELKSEKVAMKKYLEWVSANLNRQENKPPNLRIP
jgi:hypothetical protein